MTLRKAAEQLYSRFLFWRWDRQYHSAVRRMRGCAHARTMHVDVGMTLEKCRDCWALRVPTLHDPSQMEWTPNSAPPPRRTA